MNMDVSLKGQFSTMTRTAYTHGVIDSSISAVYGVRALDSLVRNPEYEVTQSNGSFPFTVKS